MNSRNNEKKQIGLEDEVTIVNPLATNNKQRSLHKDFGEKGKLNICVL